MPFVNSRADVVIKLVQNNKGNFQRITVGNENHSILRTVARQTPFLLFPRKPNPQRGGANSIMFSQFFNRLLCLTIQDQSNNRSFEFPILQGLTLD
jgi:hypothetical protein